MKVVKIQGPHIEAEAVPEYSGKVWIDLAEYAKRIKNQDLECQAKIQEQNNGSPSR